MTADDYERNTACMIRILWRVVNMADELAQQRFVIERLTAELKAKTPPAKDEPCPTGPTAGLATEGPLPTDAPH